MKKFFITVGIINLCFLVVIAGLVFLEATNPFQPGERLYSLQHTAEQARLHLTRDESQQLDYTLELADRRLADMAMASGPLSVELAVEAFDLALNESVEHLAYAPAQRHADMQQRFESFLAQADPVVASLEASLQNQEITAISQRISELLDPPDNQGLASIQSKRPPPRQIEAVPISFLGVEVEHEDFPLTGGHADQTCESCHTDGLYKGTPVECSQCHPLSPEGYARTVQEAFQRSLSFYPEHFTGECSDCHNLDNWTPTQFEHDGVLECNSCHSQDLPEVAEALLGKPQIVMVSYKPENIRLIEAKREHYPGDCMLCHSDTTEWEEFSYDHEGISECESCHVGETPVGHFSGACTNCHEDVEEWVTVSVDHGQYPDCLSCHLSDNPLEHYPGVCSSCHNSEDWSEAVFNHRGFSDCRSCHTRPTQHFAGQCSTCHEPEQWQVIAYDHTGRTPDCKNCHSEPSGHFGGSCSTCHHTTNWRDTKLDHRADSNCSNCHSADTDHYQDQCSNCHKTGGWASVTFNHSGYYDCYTCHNPPSGHYTGLCTQCHTTQNWSQIDFDHSGLVDCLSCHTAESGHYPGQCSNCHTVNSWRDVHFDHTGLNDCSSCHSIDSHWPGECSNCHNTGNWGDYTFDHSGYTNCKACHNRPADHRARGQCSNCHTTDTWEVPETPTVTPELLVGKFIAVPSETPFAPPVRTKTIDKALPAPTPPSSR